MLYVLYVYIVIVIINHMVTTNQKSIIDILTKKRKKLKK